MRTIGYKGDGGFQDCVRTQKMFALDHKISKLFYLHKRSYYIAIYYCV